tara:strand:+ start:4364 stop:5758 length:1395 start_codon:yes stop_codon:yes gene_type:complete
VGKQKSLGLVACMALVVGNMVGSGIFLLPATLAPYGSLALLGWSLTALGSICLALVFGRLARKIPKVGGPYAYTYAGFGDFAAFWIAWGYWIAIWAGNTAVAVALVGYLTVFFPILGEEVRLGGLAAIATVWLLTLVNLKGVKQAGLLQIFTTVLKLAPLVLIATLGFFWVEFENFPSFNPSGLPTYSALSVVAALTLWSFIGLESATVPAGEVEDPTRTIPQATVLGTIFVALLYIAAMTVLLGTVPADRLAGSSAPFADAARLLFGNWAYYAVAVGAVVSSFGTMNGFTLLQGQVPMAAAKDRLFPARFARQSRQGVPVFGTVISSVLMTVLLLFNYSGSKGLVEIFEFIILLATLTTLVPYIFCALVDLLLFSKQGGAFSDQQHRTRFIKSSIISIAAFVYSLWAIYGSGAETVFYGFLLLLLGIPVYVWMQREQRSDQPNPPATNPTQQKGLGLLNDKAT